MPERFVANSRNQLQEISLAEEVRQPAVIKFAAKFFSYIFHPLLIPAYIIFFLTRLNPFLFPGINDWEKTRTMLQVIVSCTFLPLVTVLLLKALGFIDSIYLKTQKDRIIPYVISMIYYFWNWYVFMNNRGAKELIVLSLAIFIACILGFLANISLKISMHSISAGVMSAFMASLAFADSSNLTLYLSIAVLITGITCTSRLIVSDHSPREIYTGLFIGTASLVLANYFA